MTNAVGVDVGGTNIRAARVDPNGKIHDHITELVERGRDAFTAQLLRLVGGVSNRDTVSVGIGIPGRVDTSDGTILSAGYLDIAGLDIPDLIGRRFNLPARVENDATMALIAEIHARPENAAGLVLMVTVGTGIGGAILVEGAPFYGGGISGQFGHLVVAADGPRCNCGRRGCVETFSSGMALRTLIETSALPPNYSVQQVIARAEAGDAAANAVLGRWSAPFNRAVETLTAAFDPRLIVIGGGLGSEMVAALRRLKSESGWFDAKVEQAKLGNTAGVIGAGLRSLDWSAT